MSNPAIRLLCPNLRCRTLLAVPMTARGKNVRCRQCGTRITVPAKGQNANKATVPQTGEQNAAG